jgi:hypothetical protein
MEFPTPEQVSEIARHLTAKTGNTWTPERKQDGDVFERRARIVRRDGVRLTLHKEWNSKNKLSVYGGISDEIPSGYSNGYRSPASIGISIEKGGERIASEIIRRYLPLLEAFASEERARRREHVSERAGMLTIARAVALALKGQLPSEKGTGPYCVSGEGISAEVNYRGSVEFKFTVDADKAAAVAKALRGLI